MIILYGKYNALSLGVRILIWMCIGVVVGIVFGQQALTLKPIGDLFIKLLLMAAIPLVFFNLLSGISSLQDVLILGRFGIKTIIYYLITTAMSLTVGLLMANYFEPGKGMTLKGGVDDSFGSVPKVLDIILGLFPSNVFEAFSSGNVAQIVVFAIFLGVATLLMPMGQKEKLQGFFTLVADLFRQLVQIVLLLGPIGVGALAASTVGEFGPKIFGPVAVFIFVVWAAQGVMVIFYLIILKLLTGRNPIIWLKTTASLYATTAATCSSLASLVVAMDVARNRLKIPEKIYTFTLPLGAQLNKDGTSIMLAGVLLFTAQAAGVEFDLASMISILLVGLLLSEGAGGIPGGGLVIAFIFVEAFNLPLEIAAIVAGIYRLIDMGSTTINVMGDLVWTTILSDLEDRKTN
jgi:Na+/H+-dicarboxylate symporter